MNDSIDTMQKKYGTVHFDSDPRGALIYVDGQLLEDPDGAELRTPATASLIEGRRDYTLSLDGYEDAVGYVDVLPGTSVSTYKRLKKGTSGGGWGVPKPQWSIGIRKTLHVQDFLDMSFDEKLEAFYFGNRLQTPAYAVKPYQMPTRMGYLAECPTSPVKPGDTFPMVISVTGLGASPYSFYISRNNEIIHEYNSTDPNEISTSWLHTVTESPGTYNYDAWIVDQNGMKSLVDSCQITVSTSKPIIGWILLAGLIGAAIFKK